MVLFNVGPRKNSKITKSKLFKLFEPVKIKPFSFNSKPAPKPFKSPIKVTPINSKSKTKNLIFGFDIPKPARKVKGKKSLSWPQAKMKYPKMNPMGDADKDGVQNWLDCRPFDSRRQGSWKEETKHMNKKQKQIKITGKVKDWEKGALNPDWKEAINYREKVAKDMNWTHAGLFDLYKNSLYDKGKLKPEYKKRQEEIYGKEKSKIVMPGHKRRKTEITRVEDESGVTVSFKPANYIRNKKEFDKLKGKRLIGHTDKEDYYEDKQGKTYSWDSKKVKELKETDENPMTATPYPKSYPVRNEGLKEGERYLSQEEWEKRKELDAEEMSQKRSIDEDIDDEDRRSIDEDIDDEDVEAVEKEYRSRRAGMEAPEDIDEEVEEKFGY